MTNRYDSSRLIEDAVTRFHGRSPIAPALRTPLWGATEAPRPAPILPRSEAPHTGLSVPALSTRERTALRTLAPTLDAELEDAERLRSSPMRQTSRSVMPGTVASEVDRLRRRARKVIEEHAPVT